MSIKLLYLFIFLSFLILHFLLCKRLLGNILSPFAIYGLLLFFLLCIVQLPVINYEVVSGKAVIIYMVTYFVFLCCSLTSNRYRWQRLFTELNSINYAYLNKIWKVTTSIFAILVLIQWFFVLKYFGSISYMMAHSMTVRVESMENQILPIYVSYPLGIGFVATGIGSFLFFFQRKRIIYKIRYCIPIIFAFISGMADFSRMTMIMHIFVFASGFCIYMSGLHSDLDLKIDKRKEKRKYFRWVAMFALIGVAALILPKYFRDGRGQTIDNSLSNYSSFEINSPIVNYIFHLFDYLAAPIVAFGKYIETAKSDILCGAAFFRPLLHLINRIIPFKYDDYALVYEYVNVPTTTNIYTWMREAFADWGYLGISLVPFIWGLSTNLCLVAKGKNSFLRYVILQYIYLYIIFGFFYTPYCQGTPTIGMGLYIMIAILLSAKINENSLGSYN